ncbi:bifunctional glycoside hydrolase 114/ polysaccharide deacetylase family protein [Uliginosibacterium flavum]|uniref:Bifunctional glycoside hydrolase 114/ polysaccharide deacetylase family protein n=1 Tax=Uliginosibacterium flavum TaxID=1396831 RepID=A0ABV2TH83_9RHOO
MKQWILFSGLVGLFFLFALCGHNAQAALQSIAFHYGADAPLDELHAFDVAVVEPDHGFDPVAYRTASSELFAYVSVGEINPSKSYANLVSADWKLGGNAIWGTGILDQSSPAWRDFFVEQIMAPLWTRGYRGFFLDTLDSYRLGGAKTDLAAQQAGLITLIQSLHRRFPGIRLIANRGFELMPDLAGEIEAVAAESLFRGWNASKGVYFEVPTQSREWLLAQLNEVKSRYGIPVIAIDYVSPNARGLARDTAAKIRESGFVPWVTDGGVSTLGVGKVEVLPRHILIVYDGRDGPEMHFRSPHRYVEMILNYFGYVADYVDASGALPAPDRGRYAGIVAWFDGPLKTTESSGRYERWLRARVGEGWRIALFNELGFVPDNDTLALLGLALAPNPSGRLVIDKRAAGVGYESEPFPQVRSFVALRLRPGAGESWLSLRDAAGQKFDGIGLTAWGGFAWRSFSVDEYAEDLSRWVVNPWVFLSQALSLEDRPVPDTTSDAGRRMLFAHMDGDGFPSRAEFTGSPYGAQVMLDEILKRYPMVPHTISVIEGELSPQGLYPQDSAALEGIARKMFELPNVEIASHTYSHPYVWSLFEANEPSREVGEDYSLAIPNYTPSFEREIIGSIDYIRTRLAPAGKPVRVMLWSGDCVLNVKAMRVMAAAKLFNMNGGDTLISRSNPSITNISPLGAWLDEYFQVYAPITNENIYTNLWRGPFYGFQRVTETFEMTGSPRRIKPIDIYFHTYSATKPAALGALRKVYDWALARSVRPVFASEFISIADSFNHVVLARDLSDGSVLVRNAGELRSMRLPLSLGEPRLISSSAIAGWNEGPDGRYLVLSAADARLHFDKVGGVETAVYLSNSNARVLSWDRNGRSVHAEIKGNVPIEFDLSNALGCAVTANKRAITGSPEGKLLRFRVPDYATTLNVCCGAC